MMIKDRIKKYRIENNLTQKQLAELLFVTRSTVAKWEQGRGIPNQESLEQLAKMMGISVDELSNNQEQIKQLYEVVENQNKKLNTRLIWIGVLLTFLLLMFNFFQSNNYHKPFLGLVRPVHTSVSPDGQHKYYIYNGTATNFFEDNNNGFFISNQKYNFYTIKENSDFKAIYWSPDSNHYILESFYHPHNKVYYEMYSNKYMANLHVILDDILKAHYGINIEEKDIDYEFIHWANNSEDVQFYYEIKGEYGYKSGYIWTKAYYNYQSYTIIEL